MKLFRAQSKSFGKFDVRLFVVSSIENLEIPWLGNEMIYSGQNGCHQELPITLELEMVQQVLLLYLGDYRALKYGLLAQIHRFFSRSCPNNSHDLVFFHH
jgi:hypothetical protein